MQAVRMRDVRGADAASDADHSDYDIGLYFFFFSSRRRHTRLQGDWSSDVCSSDLIVALMFSFFASKAQITMDSIALNKKRNVPVTQFGVASFYADKFEGQLTCTDVDRKSVV